MKIGYRIVNILLALAVFPSIIYLKFVRIFAELPLLESYFNDEFSLKDLYEFFGGGGEGFRLPELGEPILEALAPLKASAIVCAVSIVLLVLLAVAVIVCSAFTKSVKTNMVFGSLGVISALTAIFSVSHISKLITSGTVSIGNLVNALLASSDSTIGKIASLFSLGNATTQIIDLQVLQLSSAVIMQIIIFACILSWGLAYFLISLGNEREEQKPKRKHKKK